MKVEINNKTVVEKGFSTTYNVPIVKFSKMGCQINVSASKILSLKKNGKNQKIGFEVDRARLFLTWDKEGFDPIPSKSDFNKFSIKSTGMIKMISHHLGIDVKSTAFYLQEFKEGRYELSKVEV